MILLVPGREAFFPLARRGRPLDLFFLARRGHTAPTGRGTPTPAGADNRPGIASVVIFVQEPTRPPRPQGPDLVRSGIG